MKDMCKWHLWKYASSGVICQYDTTAQLHCRARHVWHVTMAMQHEALVLECEATHI